MDRIINTQNIAHIRHLKAEQTKAEPDWRQVRVYLNSPEDITLQIWRGRTYVALSLSFAETEQLASNLKAEIPDTWDGR